MDASSGSGSQPRVPALPHRAALAVVLVGVFLTGLDFFIVNVAIPSMQADLRASEAQIQLIVASYALAYGVGLITGGRLGDLYGRRRTFILGMIVFTFASAACGVATGPGFLLVARLVQGLAAALMVPQVLAILSTVYSGEARARAINWYAATAGIAAVFGQLIGGILIREDLFGLGWRACFLINLPIGLAAALLAGRYVPESRAPGRHRLDLIGMVLVTLALVGICLPLIEGRAQGWPLWVWPCLLAGGLLLTVFVRQQRWRGANGGTPSMDMALFRERAFTAGLVAQLTFFASMASYFLVLALYLQQGRHLDPLDSGLVFGVLGLGYIITSMTARKVAARLGRQTIAIGCLIRILALVLQIWAVAKIGTSGSVGWLVPGLFLDGAGMGLAIAPLAATVLARVSADNAGAASGVLGTAQQVGNALGVALVGLVFYDVLSRGGGADRAYPDAFTACLYCVLGISVLLAFVVQTLPKAPGRR
ncbi:MFS transporter [Micromonospora pisi]|uniref:MFS transporter n=1 Tax=Micromonospora pisi TaxID=589240 RepID=UPI001FEA882B|nr:MFS transporter [Micromonospora pisi]